MIKVEAENKELILKNTHGDHVIIPKDKRDWVKTKIEEGCDTCLDSYIETLPMMSDYAQDGSVIPKPTSVTPSKPDIRRGGDNWLEAQRRKAGIVKTEPVKYEVESVPTKKKKDLPSAYFGDDVDDTTDTPPVIDPDPIVDPPVDDKLKMSTDIDNKDVTGKVDPSAIGIDVMEELILQDIDRKVIPPLVEDIPEVELGVIDIPKDTIPRINPEDINTDLIERDSSKLEDLSKDPEINLEDFNKTVDIPRDTSMRDIQPELDTTLATNQVKPIEMEPDIVPQGTGAVSSPDPLDNTGAISGQNTAGKPIAPTGSVGSGQSGALDPKYVKIIEEAKTLDPKQPGKVRELLESLQKEGLKNTIQQVRNYIRNKKAIENPELQVEPIDPKESPYYSENVKSSDVFNQAGEQAEQIRKRKLSSPDFQYTSPLMRVPDHNKDKYTRTFVAGLSTEHTYGIRNRGGNKDIKTTKPLFYTYAPFKPADQHTNKKYAHLQVSDSSEVIAFNPKTNEITGGRIKDFKGNSDVLVTPTWTIDKVTSLKVSPENPYSNNISGRKLGMVKEDGTIEYLSIGIGKGEGKTLGPSQGGAILIENPKTKDMVVMYDTGKNLQTKLAEYISSNEIPSVKIYMLDYKAYNRLITNDKGVLPKEWNIWMDNQNTITSGSGNFLYIKE